MTAFVHFLPFLCIYFTGYCHGVEKRLLMTDPDVAARFHQMELALQTLTAKVTTLTQSSTTNLKGGVYVRWGRKDCPSNGTELLYTGTVGGGLYDLTGSPSEYLCLPHDPDFTGDTSSYTGNEYVSTLYGAEYQDNYFGNHLSDNDVPCALCRATDRFSVLMIPGKASCYNGWRIEYSGKLAAGANIHKAASQYICVDNNAQSLEAGNKDENGKLLYPVKAKCGSLRCPPFHENAYLTCVVCSN